MWIYPRRKAGAPGGAPERGRRPMQLTHEAVAALFSTPQGEAAQALGISLTALKVVCRKLGISRWPYARVKKARVQNDELSARLEALEAAGAKKAPKSKAAPKT